ncbi:MAG: CRISPR-associated endonuclease Cas2 [Armatimonadota bacterium]
MRLIVFFDLPVVSKTARRRYARFRKFLLRDGYDMIQFSIYSRICNGLDDVNKHIKRLKENLPTEGSIRCMQVTEKQYANMMVLIGEKKEKEKDKYSKQLSFF